MRVGPCAYERQRRDAEDGQRATPVRRRATPQQLDQPSAGHEQDEDLRELLTPDPPDGPAERRSAGSM